MPLILPAFSSLYCGCDLGLDGSGHPRAPLAVADAVHLGTEGGVGAALRGAGLRAGDRGEHRDVDLLQRTRHDVRAEVALVGVDTDAEHLLRAGCVEDAEAALAGDLELDRRALGDLVQRLLLALRLCDEVLGVVVEHLDARERLLGTVLVAGDVPVDRRDLQSADGANSAATRRLDVEARGVADEIPSLLLLEEQALDVLRLVLHRRHVDVDDRELVARVRGRHSVHRIRHQEADADRDPGAGLDARLQVRDVVGGRLRLNDTALDAALLGLLETDVREVVERLVVQTADVGNETCREGGLVRRRRRAAAHCGKQGRQKHRHDRQDRERECTLPHLDESSLIVLTGGRAGGSLTVLTDGEKPWMLARAPGVSPCRSARPARDRARRRAPGAASSPRRAR